MNCLFLLSGLQMQKLFSLLTMTRKHMWPWILRIMLLIPEVSYLPTEAPEKVQTRKIKITSCTQASLSSSSLTWMVAPFLWWITQTTVEHNFNSNFIWSSASAVCSVILSVISAYFCCYATYIKFKCTRDQAVQSRCAEYRLSMYTYMIHNHKRTKVNMYSSKAAACNKT